MKSIYEHYIISAGVGIAAGTQIAKLTSQFWGLVATFAASALMSVIQTYYSEHRNRQRPGEPPSKFRTKRP